MLEKLFQKNIVICKHFNLVKVSHIFWLGIWHCAIKNAIICH
jgi:hypothetical protein